MEEKDCKEGERDGEGGVRVEAVDKAEDGPRSSCVLWHREWLRPNFGGNRGWFAGRAECRDAPARGFPGQGGGGGAGKSD